MNNFLNLHLKELSNHFDYPELELRVLLNRASIIDKEIFFSNFKIEQIDFQIFKESFNRRLKKEPISKIFNSKEFWKYNFYVNKFVLDPRPETEFIIEKVLNYFPNKKKKLKILRSRILDKETQIKNQERAKNRKSQVGSGDRSERIRTYNFPQGRVSDHRINLTLYNLAEILEGQLNDLITPLSTDDESKKLAELNNE